MDLRGLSRLIGSLCFKSGLSTIIRVSLIVAPDNSTSSRDLGASLPLSPHLYPLLQALRVQDNTVPSHTPFAGRTAPWPEPG